MGFPSRFYFAFGSNMSPARVSERGLRFASLCGARLAGYALRFNKMSADHAGSGHANIVSVADGVVEGILYELVSFSEICRMDPYERVPVNYSRLLVEVDVAGRQVEAWTYVANPAVRREGLVPEAAYMAHLLKGRPWLSSDYCARLETWPVIGSPGRG